MEPDRAKRFGAQDADPRQAEEVAPENALATVGRQDHDECRRRRQHGGGGMQRSARADEPDDRKGDDAHHQDWAGQVDQRDAQQALAVVDAALPGSPLARN